MSLKNVSSFGRWFVSFFLWFVTLQIAFAIFFSTKPSSTAISLCHYVNTFLTLLPVVLVFCKCGVRCTCKSAWAAMNRIWLPYGIYLVLMFGWRAHNMLGWITNLPSLFSTRFLTALVCVGVKSTAAACFYAVAPFLVYLMVSTPQMRQRFTPKDSQKDIGFPSLLF